jgi:uncharacterized membrane protein YcjF (UPF0283 family)
MRISEALEEGLLRSRDRNAARGVAEEAKEEAMTTQEFAANLESLTANARHEGISDGEIIVLLREAIDTVLDDLVRNRTVSRPGAVIAPSPSDSTRSISG